MNVFVRTYAMSGYDSVSGEEVLSELREELHHLIFRTYGLTIGKQRIVYQDESYSYDFVASLDLSITIVLDDPSATSTQLTRLCQALRGRLRRKYPADKLRLKIVAITSPVGMSVDKADE